MDIQNRIQIDDIKKPNLLMVIWKDSVGSKIIATVIVSICIAIYPTIKSMTTNETFLSGIIDVLNFSVSLYLIAILIITSLIIRWGWSKIKTKYSSSRADDMYHILVGNILFGDLLNTLKSHTVKLPLNLTTDTMKRIDLLSAFLLYSRKYSLGIHETRSEEFLSHTLGGLLHSYGLLRVEKDEKSVGETIYHLSSDGIHFYRLLNIYRMLNKNTVDDW